MSDFISFMPKRLVKTAHETKIFPSTTTIPNRLRLSVVILNYRTPDYTIDCLSSLASELDVSQDRVILVDNASGDDSVHRIQTAIRDRGWSGLVHLLEVSTNWGFSSGNNEGILAAPSTFYLLLNSDTIIRPGTIQVLLRMAVTFPHAGIISPRLEWPDGKAQVSSFRFLSPVTELIRAAGTRVVTKIFKAFDILLPVSDLPREVEWTSFACVLIRSEVIEQVGYLDEGYFLYFEDVDYCRRVRKGGWKILNCPEARVVHLRGGSSPVKECLEKRKRPPRYYYESRTRYFAKFYGMGGLWLTNLAWLLGRSISLIRETLQGKEKHTVEGEAWDIWVNWLRPMVPPHRLKGL